LRKKYVGFEADIEFLLFVKETQLGERKEKLEKVKDARQLSRQLQ